jgi:hypothetical protein
MLQGFPGSSRLSSVPAGYRAAAGFLRDSKLRIGVSYPLETDEGVDEELPRCVDFRRRVAVGPTVPFNLVGLRHPRACRWPGAIPGTAELADDLLDTLP